MPTCARPVGAGGDFGLRHDAGQEMIEQTDMGGLETSRSLHEQFRDAARDFCEALGSPRLTISSSPGINDVATVMKTTQPGPRDLKGNLPAI